MTEGRSPAWIEEGSCLGAGCSVGAYSVIRRSVALGARCMIGAHVVIEGEVKAGDDVVIGSQCCVQGRVLIAPGIRIGPQSCIQGTEERPTEIREGAVIGSQTMVQAGVIVGEKAVLEPGAVVFRNVPACAVVAGNPARIIRYVATSSTPSAVVRPSTDEATVSATSIPGVTIHHLPLIEDLRGTLSFGEIERHVPFSVKRYFLTFDVASEEVRGEHAHRRLHQFLLCVHGRLHIAADDGQTREEFILDRPNIGLHLPPMIWGVQYRFSPGAVLLVLCSEYYEPADYIREYAEFIRSRSV